MNRGSTRLAITSTLTALATGLFGSPASSDTVQIVADRDNTLIEIAGGIVSGGLMPFFFAGDTNQGPSVNTRRGLIRFDVSSIPPGSSITSASVRLFMSKSAIAGPANVTLHRVLADWGEGTTGGDGGTGGFSTPGSATWLHRFYPDVFWSDAGGDFVAAPSAAIVVAGIESYLWTSPQIAADVHQWVASPSGNFGWLLKGSEGSAVSAKRFESREAAISTDRPTLIIEFVPPACTADVDGDELINVTDLLAVIGAWGPCAGCAADIDGDGSVNVTDLLAVIGAWGPCP